MKKFLLIAILIVGCFLRTYQVSINPPSLSWDEVSIGYNAYSLLKTGRDEHGRFMPLDSFIAYGDYKPPFAIYSAVPFVFLFGLTDLGVRMPAAVFGTLSIFLTYLVVIELFTIVSTNKKTTGLSTERISSLAIIASALLAISPWHINISRGGFEANIAHCFVLLGIWCILSARHNRNRYPYIWLPFVAAIYTFNSARYFVPLLSIVLIAFTHEEIKKNYKRFIIGLAVAIIALLPILPHLVSKEARLRFKEVNIFTDVALIEQANIRTAREGNSIFSTIVNNRRVGYIRSYLMHFTDNLQPDFLFIRGDGNPKFSIRDTGQLYIIEAPLLVVGILSMFSLFPIQAIILVYWLLASIVPAATARETPHALRILNSLPTWHIFIAFGIITIVGWAKQVSNKKMIATSVCILLILLYLLQTGYYLHQYYAHFPKEFSGEWQYGYKEALQKIQPLAKGYEHIAITDSIGRPYMYTAFYTKADPQELLSIKRSYFDAAGFYHVDGFGKYIFLETLPLAPDGKTLYVWDADEIPVGVRVLDTVRLLNGEPKLVIFDTGEVKQ